MIVRMIEVIDGSQLPGYDQRAVDLIWCAECKSHRGKSNGPEANTWLGCLAGLLGWLLLAWLVGSVLTRSSLQILAAGYGAWTLSGCPATNDAKCCLGFARELLYFDACSASRCEIPNESSYQVEAAMNLMVVGWGIVSNVTENETFNLKYVNDATWSICKPVGAELFVY